MRNAVVVWRRTRLLAFALVGAFAASCGPDLGECDMTMLGGSEDVMMPSPHSGQLVINRNCANSRCHSAGAKGALRVGAPAELNFDVVPGSTSAEEISKTREGASVVFDNRESMWAEIEGGSMPPGRPAAGGELSATDKEVVRNWLACGAPVIATPAPVTSVGADWTAIYEAFVGSSGLGCNACHGANPASGDGFMLGETGDACAAYNRVVNTLAVTDAGSPPCANTHTLVVPNNPSASLLVSKLEGTQDCGASMPYLQPPLGPSHPVVMDLRAWIMAGAPKPAGCP